MSNPSGSLKRVIPSSRKVRVNPPKAPPKSREFSTSSTVPSSTSVLPNEVLSMIITRLDFVDRPSLARLCRTSRQMFDLASPILYKRITIGNDPQMKARRDCASKDRGRCSRKDRLLAYVEEVTLNHHWSDDRFRELAVPWRELQVLRIQPYLSQRHAARSRPDHEQWITTIHPQLQAKKLVLRAAEFRETRQPQITTSAPERVQEVVYILPFGQTHTIPALAKGATPKLNRLVFIFQTASPTAQWRTTEAARFMKAENEDNLIRDLRWMASIIADRIDCIPTCSFSSVLIVNASSLNIRADNDPSMRNEKWEMTMEERFAQRLLMEAYDGRKPTFRLRYGPFPAPPPAPAPCTKEKEEEEEEKESNSKGFIDLRFLTMREYLDNENWRGEFDHDDVQEWLDCHTRFV